jgi:uncharacterized protein YbjQ (UPF0145 family)
VSPLFHRRSEEEKAAEKAAAQARLDNAVRSDERTAASLVQIEQGHIPVAASERLTQFTQAGAGPTAFSSEMNVLSQAMYEARELAMTRMEEEAEQLGADGIVGVRLVIGRYDWGESMAEFIAMGTAVKHRAGELHRAPSGRPFTSDLSGQEFWTLLQTGHRPVGLVMGSCVYHVAHQSWRQSIGNTGRNVELPNFTQALYDARELAMERMQAEALQAKAEGIVGVHIEEKSHGWGSHVIEFFAIGTAIIPSEGIEDHVIPAPQTVLDLS